jgi:hypothetical protein
VECVPNGSQLVSAGQHFGIRLGRSVLSRRAECRPLVLDGFRPRPGIKLAPPKVVPPPVGAL